MRATLDAIDEAAVETASMARQLSSISHSQRNRVHGQPTWSERVKVAEVIQNLRDRLGFVADCYKSLLDRFADDDPTRKDLEEIEQATGRASSLANQLYATSFEVASRPRALSLNALLSDMERTIGCLVDPEIGLIIALDPELGPVEAEQTKMERVVLNLVVNARDAMPNGGRLTIETAVAPLDDRRRCAVLSVSDTECGMDQETLSCIFEPYFTTKRNGTGLGLSIVQEIVRDSGGHIQIHSQPGCGTTFTVYLLEQRDKAHKYIPHTPRIPRLS
jgi:hypothetical protein